MSNAAIGIDKSVVVLLELNPMRVFHKLAETMRRYPDTSPVLQEVLYSVDQLVDSLNEDYAIIERAKP